MSAKRKTTYLPTETALMERKRREEEQRGHHVKFATKVHAREHAIDTPQGDEPGVESNIKQHPYLDTPIYDGIDPNINPLPALNTDARREFDNAQREKQLRKELQKQLNLDNAPKYSSTPKPRPY